MIHDALVCCTSPPPPPPAAAAVLLVYFRITEDWCKIFQEGHINSADIIRNFVETVLQCLHNNWRRDLHEELFIMEQTLHQ